MGLEEFMVKVRQRPLPNNPMARIRILAKELAEGAAENIWPPTVDVTETLDDGRAGKFKEVIWTDEVSQYLTGRWNNEHPSFALLESRGYLHKSKSGFRLAEPAFQLLDESEPSTIFISYKRSESSEFALLVLARLKAAGLDSFMDMALVPGEDWHTGIKERIQQRDYFIVLLGKETLNSEVVKKEIAWALEAGLIVIPIWHHGFEYVSGAWDVAEEIDNALSNTHTIRVLEESPLAYNNAIVELLNRFGITP